VRLRSRHGGMRQQQRGGAGMLQHRENRVTLGFH
jgi:hypothetical protein